MTIFKSQFEKLAPFSAAFVGGYAIYEVVTPDVVDTAIIGKHAADILGTDAAMQLNDAGMLDPAADLGTAFPPAIISDASIGAFSNTESWMHRGDYTGIGVGGNSDGFYLIDSETSYSDF